MSEINKWMRHHLKRAAVPAILCATFIAVPAQAHKLNIFAFSESGKVAVDSYFVDGSKARDSKVQVFDPNGKVVAEGITDKQGHFEFPVPGQFDLKIAVDAGMGHRAEWLLPAADLGAVSGNKPVVGKPQIPAENKNTPVNIQVSEGTDSAALRQVVDEAVAEAIKPLVRTIEESQQHASLTQIIGSIGYIFGILGLWAFFKSRGNGSTSAKEKPSADR